MAERYEAIAERWLDVSLRGSSEWMCACPFCEGGHSLQFNVRKGVWLCFKCGKKGTAQSLVTALGGSWSNPAVSTEMVEKALEELTNDIHLKLSGRSPILPESYLQRFGGKPHEYWVKRRKFTKDTISRWDLGFDAIGPKLWNGENQTWDRVGPSVTLPYRTPDGDLLGVFHRRLGEGFPRYIYPKQFDRIGSLFGSWRLDDPQDQGSVFGHCCLVEGSTDAIRIDQIGFHAAGQYGSNLHPLQVKLLKRMGIKEAVLFYDYDPSGIKATKQAAEVLDGLIIRSVQWDRDHYCWHGKLCNCGLGHDPMELGACKKKKDCRCGREHDVDPGDWKRLPASTVMEMVENAPLYGRRKKWFSSPRKRGSSRQHRRRGSA